MASCLQAAQEARIHSATIARLFLILVIFPSLTSQPMMSPQRRSSSHKTPTQAKIRFTTLTNLLYDFPLLISSENIYCYRLPFTIIALSIYYFTVEYSHFSASLSVHSRSTRCLFHLGGDACRRKRCNTCLLTK